MHFSPIYDAYNGHQSISLASISRLTSKGKIGFSGSNPSFFDVSPLLLSLSLTGRESLGTTASLLLLCPINKVGSELHIYE